MQKNPSELINVSELQIGMFVELELGWISHPFPTGSFKISSDKQIETIRGLGLTQVRYVPIKSDSLDSGMHSQPAVGEEAAAQTLAKEREFRKRRAALIVAQQRSLQACEQKFGVAQQQYQQVLEHVLEQPLAVRDQCVALISGVIKDMECDGESAIRLLSEGVGERAVMHSVNVTVMSLLLGKAMGMVAQDLLDVGVAAFLHDMGKLQLLPRVRLFEGSFSSDEFKQYQEHVNKGVSMANRMQLTEGALMAIAQHHEMMDGSGFPMRLSGSELTLPARILALTNSYDTLCNPPQQVKALTPHEALALLFSQHKARYDKVALSTFIRMMGVYPPGSVVQLIDGRFALVVSVNSVRPLKPRVIVHEPAVPKHEALILDLEHQPGIGIRRSLKPAELPADAFDYLAPRQRIAYFFENLSDAADTDPAGLRAD
jgi:HD-GYP domain-containing protein (c-di-GMP phosphodiesterase class II)